MAELTEAEQRILAYTLLGEAAGEGKKGMEAVMWTIMNRADSGRYPSNPALVATQKNSKGVHQYSTWNKKTLGGNSPEDRFSPDSPKFKEALAVVRRVMAGEGKDPTGGATHFYAKGSAKPSWFDEEGPAGEIKIGNHRFAARNTVDDATRATDAAELLATGRIQQQPQAYAAEPDATPSSGLTTRTVKTIDASSLPGYESLRTTVPSVSVNTERNRLNSIRSNPANAQDLTGAAARQVVTNAASVNKVSRGAPQDLTGPAARATPQNAAASAKTDRAGTTVPAYSAVQAQNRTVEQIGQEADNARLSGYRDIQEAGPSSQGAKATPQRTTVRPESGLMRTAGTVGDKSGPQPLTIEQVEDDPSKPRLVADNNGFVKPFPKGAPAQQIRRLGQTINRLGERYGGIKEAVPEEAELATLDDDADKKKKVVDARKEVLKRGAPPRGAVRAAQPAPTPTQQLLQQMRGNANYLPGQIAAIERNAGFYSPSPGVYMPTMAPGGVPRNTYGDISPSEYAAQEERKNNQSKMSGKSSWQWW
jgi:N-acetylmuramoyl-L-alanine amidase